MLLVSHVSVRVDAALVGAVGEVQARVDCSIKGSHVRRSQLRKSDVDLFRPPAVRRRLQGTSSTLIRSPSRYQHWSSVEQWVL